MDEDSQQARHIETDEQHIALKNAFHTFDLDDDEHLSKQELRSILQMIGQNPTQQDVDDYFPNGEERCTKSDFEDRIEKNIKLKSQAEIDEELFNAFLVFGMPEDFKIPKETFIDVMTTKGSDHLTVEQAEELMTRLDTNKDGTIDVKELAVLFHGEVPD